MQNWQMYRQFMPDGSFLSGKLLLEHAKARGFRKPIDDLVVNATDLLKSGLLIGLRGDVLKIVEI